MTRQSSNTPIRSRASVPIGASDPVVKQVEAFTISCFSAGLTGQGGKPATCELSAAVTVGKRVALFNDKPIPGSDRSSVLTLDPTNPSQRAKPDYVLDPNFLAFRKYEDATTLADGTILVTTGFDRIRPDASWDAYNGLLHWRPGSAPQLLAASTREGISSSRSLRPRIAAALAKPGDEQGPPYFKVEGLAGLDDGRILFGIRELGASYENFDFVITILAAPNITALEAAPLVRLWDLNATKYPQIKHPIGLSSLGVDRARRGLWMTTSWETGDTDIDLGGYLWWIPLEALDHGRAAQLAHLPNGRPLVFAHKPEAVTVLPDGRLLVVHDDDRITGREPDTITDPSQQFSRGLHESAAEILTVEQLRRR